MTIVRRGFSRRQIVATSSATAVTLIVASRSSGAPASPEAAVSIPDSPSGRQLTWVLDQLVPNATPLSDKEIQLHFAPSFLQAVPVDQLRSVFQQIVEAYAPLVLTGVNANPNGTEILADVETNAGEAWNIYIAVEDSGDERMVGLQFAPAAIQATPVPVTGFDDLIDRWTSFAPLSGLLIAEIVDGGLEPIVESDSIQQMAIGSDFKLYVLGAVATAVGAGSFKWTDELGIEDRLKSLPSGDLQNEIAGTKLPIRTFADKMISISDNTAADHLLNFVGRDAVEAMLPEMGNSDPSRSLPFLSTAELFKLKLVASEEQRDTYISADVETRRDLLENAIDSLSFAGVDLTSWTGPREIATLEWFASPLDLAHAMHFFHESQAKPGFEPIADILAINPGIEFDPKTWTYVGFKGGSEPGVLALAWLLRRADERRFVVTCVLNDANKALDETNAILTFAGSVPLLAELK